MKIRKKILFMLALCLSAMALLLFYSAEVVRSHYSPRLQQAVQIKRGLILSSDLEDVIDDFYDISLNVERILPFERTNCLLAIKTEAAKIDQCREVTPIGEIKWSLYDGEKLVASGVSSGVGVGWWGPTIGRNIGRFKGVAHKKYVLRVESDTDTVEINQANPKIVVSINAMSFKGVIVSTELIKLVALVIGVLGAIIFLTILMGRILLEFKSKERLDRMHR